MAEKSIEGGVACIMRARRVAWLSLRLDPRNRSAISGRSAKKPCEKKNAAICAAVPGNRSRKLGELSQCVGVHVVQSAVNRPGAAEDQATDQLWMPCCQYLRDQASEGCAEYVHAAPACRLEQDVEQLGRIVRKIPDVVVRAAVLGLTGFALVVSDYRKAPREYVHEAEKHGVICFGPVQ